MGMCAGRRATEIIGTLKARTGWIDVGNTEVARMQQGTTPYGFYIDRIHMKS